MPVSARLKTQLRDIVTRYMNSRLDEMRAPTAHDHCFAWTGFALTTALARKGPISSPFQWHNLCHEHDPRFAYIAGFTQTLATAANAA